MIRNDNFFGYWGDIVPNSHVAFVPLLECNPLRAIHLSNLSIGPVEIDKWTLGSHERLGYSFQLQP
jgi:hypothetical protein